MIQPETEEGSRAAAAPEEQGVPESPAAVTPTAPPAIDAGDGTLLGVQNLSDNGQPVMQDCQHCTLFEPAEQLVECQGCNDSYHRVKCLNPPLYRFPEEWHCGGCGGDSDTRTLRVDITLDQPVMQWLAHHSYPTGTDRKEPERFRKRARGFELRNIAGDDAPAERQLWKLPTAKTQQQARRVPAITARHGIVQSAHDAGHFGEDKVRGMILTQYYWENVSTIVQQVISGCHTCQMVKEGQIVPWGVNPIPAFGVFHR